MFSPPLFECPQSLTRPTRWNRSKTCRSQACGASRTAAIVANLPQHDCGSLHIAPTRAVPGAGREVCALGALRPESAAACRASTRHICCALNFGKSDPSRSVRELDQIAACECHVFREDGGAALVEVPSRILFVVGVFRRHSVNRHDSLVAALHSTVAGADDRALGGGAGYDYGLDALVFESLLEVGADELVRPTPDHPLAATWREVLVDHTLRCRSAPDQRIEHHHVVSACRIQQLFDIGNGRAATRAHAAIRLHEIKDQTRRP